MSGLKVGNEFIVFKGNIPSLWCYVDAVLPSNEVRCKVINGGWSFIMDQLTGDAVWQSPHGTDQDNFVWVGTDNIPGFKGGNYNDVMNHIEEIGFTPRSRMPMKLYVLRFIGWVARGSLRVKEAFRAFHVVLTGKGCLKEDSKARGMQWDDDIPF